MRVDRDRPAEGPLISGFAGTRFRVEGSPRPGGVALTPERADDWTPAPVTALSEADLGFALAMSPPPEFILLGTGNGTVPPPPALAARLERQGIGIEAMDSRAAARAWGLLRAEGRWIAMGLYPLD